MQSTKSNYNSVIRIWLLSMIILVFLMIMVGGLTRLTNSGLSITEWELFEGILPPLSNEAWIAYFNSYKLIPQYQLLNFDMNLDEFKVIFYWEYVHRILARIIGLFFLIPLIFFYFSNKINKKYTPYSFIMFMGGRWWCDLDRCNS